MTNKQIALAFDELANLLELHEENEFKIRSYRNAYLTIRKLDRPLAEVPESEIKALKGIGPAISSKIQEVLSSGQIKALDEARAKTPEGVVEMLQINGFGPKKVRQVWTEMGIETVGELWYACNENRLIEFKGFGFKTQEDLQKKLEYYFRSKGKMHCDAAEILANEIGALITSTFRGAFVTPVGEVRRHCPIVSQVEMLIGFNGELEPLLTHEDIEVVTQTDATLTLIRWKGGPTCLFHQCHAEDFGSKLFQFTGSPAFVQAFVAANPGLQFKGLRMEEEVFEKANMAFVAPEIRESDEYISAAQSQTLPKLIVQEDLRGVLHVHTTWSDGLHTLRQMAERASDLGYDYIGITDHSQSAFYANGLKTDRLKAQWAEIDALNASMGSSIRILKGIESDILNDGSLDYTDDLLEQFDFVIASVHSNLKMTIEKATERVIRAIEHPCTTILGHPTGRLLLSREGYPLDWDAVFEACAKHGVAIELNAHPYRLDIDWTLIGRAVAHGISISINPDAHSLDGLEHVRYGVQIARKGGLTAANCFNVQTLGTMLE